MGFRVEGVTEASLTSVHLKECRYPEGGGKGGRGEGGDVLDQKEFYTGWSGWTRRVEMSEQVCKKGGRGVSMDRLGEFRCNLAVRSINGL